MDDKDSKISAIKGRKGPAAIDAKPKGRRSRAAKSSASNDGNIERIDIDAALLEYEAKMMSPQTTDASQASDGTRENLTQAERDAATKQNGRSTSGVPTNQGAFSPTNIGSSNVGSELRGLEADILAKQSAAASQINATNTNTMSSATQAQQDNSAKQNRRNASDTPSKPGAFSATNSGTGTVGSELQGLEADILAKTKTGASRRNATSDSTNTSSLTQEEKDTAAKQKGRNGSVSQTKPGAFLANNNGIDAVRSELHGFEADILSKQTAVSSRMNSTGDNNGSRLTQLNQDNAAKNMSRSSYATAMPGAYAATSGGSHSADTQLSGFEADILAKQNGSVASTQPGAFSAVHIGQNNGDAELCALEADVLAKQNAAMKPSSCTPTDNYKEPPDNFELTDRKSSSSSIPSELRDLDHRIQSKVSKESGTTSFNANPEIVPLREQPTWEIRRIDADAEIKSSHVQRHASQALQSLREIENAAAMKLKTQPISDNVSSRGNIKQGERKPFIETDSRTAKDETISPGLMSSGQDPLNGLEFGEYGGDEEDGLAIAVAVVEEDKDTYLPAAVEYDPDAKPPMYRNRRFRMYVCLAVTAVIVGTVGAVLGITMTNEGVSQEIPYRATLGIRENVARIVNNEQLDDYSSAYSKALDWIMYADPIAITPDNPKFFQRYLLAYFYYSTSVNKPWDACNPPVEGESDTCQYTYLEDRLEDRKTTKNGRRWLSGTEECLWVGVDCDDSFQVRGIEISGIGMTGKFPEGIFKLPKFQQIIAGYGELEGPLPPLTNNIHIFDVRGNHFTGTIPDQWLETRSLQYIDVTSSNITGIISPNIYEMIDIKTIKMDDNELVGTIPETIGKMPNLLALHVSQNKINGTIPTEFGNIEHMWSLWLFGNDLMGTIPTEFGKWVNLASCRLQNNFFSGPIPDEFWNAQKIYELHLFENNLSGTISGRISDLNDLYDLDIHSNQFTGNLPARLPTTPVTIINARDNNFSGTVPAQICDATARGDFQLVEMDCAVPLSGGAPEVDCPSGCCTSCCQPDGSNCEPVA